MKYRAELFLDTIRFKSEIEDGDKNHGTEVIGMYNRNKTKKFKAKDFTEAFVLARYFSCMNETDSVILTFKDDKYNYNATVCNVVGLETDLIVEAIDGRFKDVSICSFDILNDNLEGLIEEEIASWA